MAETISAEFTQPRMQRCFDVFGKIRAVKEGKASGTCRVISDSAWDGKSLSDLAHQKFAAGVDDDLTELPLIDLLIVFQMLSHFEENRSVPDGDRRTFVFPTEFRSDSALSILRQIQREFGVEVG